jgi:hypothetical protein
LSASGGFAAFFLYASLFEYVFHRWVLHRPSRLLGYPYRTHTLLHHKVFQRVATYGVASADDPDRIHFQWWEAALVLGIHVPAVWGIEALTDLPVFWSGLTAVVAYYGFYESLHWCIHRPTGRWIERTRVFRRLAAHHRLHHRLWRVNFNVVLPLGDLVFGTYRLAVPSAHGCGAGGACRDKRFDAPPTSRGTDGQESPGGPMLQEASGRGA